MAEDEAHGVEPQDAAAEAFEALRAEVAQLRTALEGLPTTAPDYSPNLAAIAQSLAAMDAHPALRLTPDALASQVRQASEAAQEARPAGAGQRRPARGRGGRGPGAPGRAAAHWAGAGPPGRDHDRRGRRRRCHRVGVFLGASRARSAGELERAGEDGRRNAEPRSLGCWRAADAERQPAGLGAGRGMRKAGAGEPSSAGGLLEGGDPDGKSAAVHRHGQGRLNRT